MVIECVIKLYLTKPALTKFSVITKSGVSIAITFEPIMQCLNTYVFIIS